MEKWDLSTSALKTDFWQGKLFSSYPEKCGSNFISVFFLRIDILSTACEIGLMWVPWNRIDNRSTFVQVMAWCHQAQAINGANVDPNLYCEMASLGHNDLIHWGRVTHICICKLTIIGIDDSLSHGWCQAIIWTLNQCWNIVNWTLRNKLQWNFNCNWSIFIDENTFQNIICESCPFNLGFNMLMCKCCHASIRIAFVKIRRFDNQRITTKGFGGGQIISYVCIEMRPKFLILQ